MAKKKTKKAGTSRSRRGTGADAASRVSTRRPAAAGRRAAAPRRAAPARAARAPRETIAVTFDLRDVSERPISDPETFFTFRSVADRRQIGNQMAVAVAGAPVAFELPASASDITVCEIDPKRYRFAHSAVFFRTPGNPVGQQRQLFREPKEWTPRFTRWDDLSDDFEHLKRVLEASSNVALFKTRDTLQDPLVEDAYDDVSDERIVLAKTALLNTYYRLRRAELPISGDSHWFSLVSRLVAVGQERFLAFVEPKMETLVRQIHEHIGEFRGVYERTPAENHRGNVPEPMQGRITGMVSIKSAHSKGNFQLTLTHLSSPDEVLLDADIDENGELLGHLGDLFKHKITGGTHPNDVHEILVLQDGQTAGFDLGYELT